MASQYTDAMPTKARNHDHFYREQQLHKRVDHYSGNRSGRLEDQNLDIDARTLAILGKRQQLNRNFGLVSLVAFSTVLEASWVSVAVTFQDGMVNGGPASLFYGLIFCWLGSMAVAASLGELTSMAPTAGAQYHWVAGLAPVRFATIFSWAAGWLTVFSRISLYASSVYANAQVIMGLVVLNVPGYTMIPWHGTMAYLALILLTTLPNILGIRKFPHLETIAFIWLICMFFIYLVPLTYLTPQSTAQFVFTDFENSSGWSSDGLSWFLGLMNGAYCFLGIDGTSHMAEEVRNSSKVVPRSMVWSQFINGVFGIAMTIIILFGVGDLQSALSTKTKVPIIQILFEATKSKGATTALISFISVVMFFVAAGVLASASRLTWAFARDYGLPFPKFFAHVNTNYMIPMRAVLFVAIISALIVLVNLGSTTAFHAMVSLALIGHYISYFFPILLLTIRRFNHKEIPFGPWSLGHWGLAINLATLGYLAIIIVFMVFPVYQPVTPETLNYAGPIFGLSLLFCVIAWFTYGRTTFHGPVQEVLEEKDIKP